MLGALAELMRALAIDGGTTDGEGLGHGVFSAARTPGAPGSLGLPTELLELCLGRPMVVPARFAGTTLCRKRLILLGLASRSRTLSAVPPKADIDRQFWNVR
jgi:hypothetical protein